MSSFSNILKLCMASAQLRRFSSRLAVILTRQWIPLERPTSGLLVHGNRFYRSSDNSRRHEISWRSSRMGDFWLINQCQIATSATAPISHASSPSTSDGDAHPSAAPDSSCWSCQHRFKKGGVVCTGCEKIQPLDTSLNYFELLGL